MSFTTTVYFVFLLIGLVFYYLIPKNYRWTVLLVMSYIYYLSYRLKAVVFILFTTITVYLLGIMLERIQNGADAYLAQNKQVLSREEKKSYKNKIKYKKRILHIVHDFYDDSLENEDEVFEVFYIRKNPAYVYIRGNAIFKINNHLIDLKQMKQYFV